MIHEKTMHEKQLTLKLYILYVRTYIYTRVHV